MIRITAKKDGFRRAGMAHAGTRDYPDSAFTPDELVALKVEPLLVVEMIAPAKADDKPAKPDDKPAKPDAKPEPA